MKSSTKIFEKWHMQLSFIFIAIIAAQFLANYSFFKRMFYKRPSTSIQADALEYYCKIQRYLHDQNGRYFDGNLNELYQYFVDHNDASTSTYIKGIIPKLGDFKIEILTTKDTPEWIATSVKRYDSNYIGTVKMDNNCNIIFRNLEGY